MVQIRKLGEGRTRCMPPLERLAKGSTRNRKEVFLRVVDVLSLNPDPARAKEIRQTMTFLRGRVIVAPSQRQQSYVPLSEGEGKEFTIDEAMPLVRKTLRDVECPEDIEDLEGLGQTEALLTIAATIAAERPVRLGQEDFETFNEMAEAVEFSCSPETDDRHSDDA